MFFIQWTSCIHNSYLLFVSYSRTVAYIKNTCLYTYIHTSVYVIVHIWFVISIGYIQILPRKDTCTSESAAACVHMYFLSSQASSFFPLFLFRVVIRVCLCVVYVVEILPEN